jgi:hypothetical protein
LTEFDAVMEMSADEVVAVQAHCGDPSALRVVT